MKDAYIHLYVPASTKGRWIRASRAAGMRLTDWIENAVESHLKQQMTQIIIPEDITFADLQLARDPHGNISFSWAAIERVCKASGLPIEQFKDTPEDNISELIAGWYQAHCKNGGARDPVADDLIGEIVAETRAGQHISHPPGRA